MKNLLRFIFFTLPPILAGVAVIAYFVTTKKPPAQAPVEEQVTHVRVIDLQPSEIIPTAIGYGVVRPAKTWNGISQVGGKVIYVHPDFQKGASLAADTIVVKLSPSDYNLAIAQAEANIRSTEARLKELGVNEENTRQSLKIEEEALELKRADLERKQKLLNRGSVAQNTVDVARSGHLAQRQKVLGMKNSLSLVPTQRSVLKEQIQVYRSSLETANLNLMRTNIKLPFDARVVETKTEISQYLVPGQSIGSFDGIENAEIEAQIPIEQFGRMLNSVPRADIGVNQSAASISKLLGAMGLTATVRLNLGDRPVFWKAVVSRISDTIDPKTRTVGVIVTVLDPYKGVRPGTKPPLTKGMFVEVLVSNKPILKALLVPRSALHASSVYLANGENRLEIRPVSILLQQGDLAVISNGLEKGDKIIVSPLNPAVPGMLLKLSADEKLAQSIKQQALLNGETK